MPKPSAIFAFMPADDEAAGGRLHALFVRISRTFLDASDAGRKSVERFVAAASPPDELRAANAILAAVVTPNLLADAAWRVALEHCLAQRRVFGHGSRLLTVSIADAGFGAPDGDPLAAAIPGCRPVCAPATAPRC